jgi:hypothetical protein
MVAIHCPDLRHAAISKPVVEYSIMQLEGRRQQVDDRG